MKIYAKQIAPEFQDPTSIYVNFDFENLGIVVTGNDCMLDINKNIVERAKEAYDNIEEDSAIFNKKGESLSEEQISILRKSAQENRFEDFLVDYLSAYFSEEYEQYRINGCCQREWNYAYMPKRIADAYYLRLTEAVYFNTGIELEILELEGDEEIDDPSQIEDGYRDYFVGDNLENEIKERYGENCEVTIWMFDD